MRQLTDDEVAQRSKRLVTVIDGARMVRLTAPAAATEIAGFAYRLMITCAPNYEEEHFAGAIVWLHRWEIWSESIDNQGYALLNGLRLSSADNSVLDETPAMEFSAGEFFDATACVLLPLLFQWDAELLSVDGTVRCSMSHHGQIELRISEAERSADMLQRFGQYSPVEVSSA
jgi:hypothetical protein